MLDKADAIFKLALAFAAVAIGGAVAYYYALFLPQQAQQSADRELAAETAKHQNEVRESLEKSKTAKEAKEKYDLCVSFAYSDYNSRWAKTCTRLNKADVARRDQCLNNGYNEAYCSTISVTPAKECSLPNELADDYEKSHEDDKKLCLEEFKAAT